MPAGPRQIGRYAMYDALASGGMATVHLGRLAGAAGFARTVAIKVLRPQFAEDADFVAMFVDEARLAARIHHPNVVPTLDVISNEGELFSVMEYVHGEVLSRLLRTEKEPPPLGIVSSVMRDALLGLQAAHEATDEHGQSLGVVHRDVSPQNIIVGADGVARVLDFGVAKAAGRTQTTREGQLKGKLSYMAPEQLQGEATATADIFAASVVLWEALTGKRLFRGTEGEIVYQILHAEIPSPRTSNPEIPEAVAAIALKGLQRSPEDRFKTAREMADALVAACPPASYGEVGQWVNRLAASVLYQRQSRIREIESVVTSGGTATSSPPPRERSRRTMAVVAVGLAAIVAIGGVLAFALRRAARGDERGASTSSASVATVVSASAPPNIVTAPTWAPATTSAHVVESVKRRAKPDIPRVVPVPTTPDHI